uniref:Carrier domain-containing protein n=1 Tax=Leersia perrieri TaxID=77586 RepID=A0A0D9VW19_9ORYZ
MAIEQEFSVEIPDDKADKLSCCADVAKYIISESQSNTTAVAVGAKFQKDKENLTLDAKL